MGLDTLPNPNDLTGIHTPEIPDQTGPWFNSAPLKIANLNNQNKIVLIDFWTYSCINCLRTLPYIKKWHEKYFDIGLIIIGVHTPEFEFEKEPQNVEKFIKKQNVTYPVVMDNEQKIWNSFANRYWPRKYLVDTKGIIRLDHAGEGFYSQTEKKIQELLKEATGAPLPNVEPEHHHISQGAVCYPMTAELYAGYLRGLIGNESGFVEEKSAFYKSPDFADYHDGKLYLQGNWLAKDEFVQHSRGTSEPDDFVAIRYHGLEVNVVLKSEKSESYQVWIQRDGKSLEKEFAGGDVQFDSEGSSFIEVSEPKLYNIVKDKNQGDHILKLLTLSDQMQLFAYTFGGCAD